MHYKQYCWYFKLSSPSYSCTNILHGSPDLKRNPRFQLCLLMWLSITTHRQPSDNTDCKAQTGHHTMLARARPALIRTRCWHEVHPLWDCIEWSSGYLWERSSTYLRRTRVIAAQAVTRGAVDMSGTVIWSDSDKMKHKRQPPKTFIKLSPDARSKIQHILSDLGVMTKNRHRGDSQKWPNQVD